MRGFVEFFRDITYGDSPVSAVSPRLRAHTALTKVVALVKDLVFTFRSEL